MSSILPSRLPQPSDPAAVALGRQHWLEQAGELEDPDLAAWARQFADSDTGRLVQAALFGNSPYLSQLAIADPATLREILEHGPDAVLESTLSQLWENQRDQQDVKALMAAMRRAKRRAALAIALADIAGTWELARVTGALSDVAELGLRLSVRLLLRQAAAAKALELPDPSEPEQGSGLIVLAMGKLGARELNYSSDIDLMVLYDDGVVKSADPDGIMRTFIRMTRELVRLMEEKTADGYVFRTDLRLRPDPGATPLAVSLSAAEAYYGSLGQNWERAAMIKARPVAGDPRSGKTFLDIIRDFIWRRNLDFAAIQDIHSIKRQIGAHKGHRRVAVNGHNIKIGRGGIREIEFFAQTQQLIYGGRDVELRTSGTCAALDALVEASQIKPDAAAELKEAYAFLRRVEHRIQMIEDQQTHSLPESDDDVAKLAVFLGFADAGQFRDTLLAHLGKVEDHYAHLFEEAPSLSGQGSLVFTGTDDDPETIETLTEMGFEAPSVVAAQVRAWHHGRYRSTRSQRARELLTELVPSLLEAIGKTAQPDQAFLKFDEFLSKLPAGVQLFSLFYSNPALLELVAEILGTAPRLAALLARRPQELDAVLTPGFTGPLPDAATLEVSLLRTLRDVRHFEEALILIRRWTNEQRFRAGVHILRGITDADHCGSFLTAVAEIGLTQLQRAVEEDFVRRYGRIPGAGMAVIGMGRLGGKSLSLRSDLDLITVYEVPSDATESDGPRRLSPAEYFIKLTQSLINAITAQTEEGQFYEVDMRLRPSGSKGPLAVSFEAFAKYQRESAWTWEHMALCRARVVSGPPELRARLTAEVAAVLCRPRDPERLLHDVASMRQRIAREKGGDDVWDVKNLRGGMVDIQFIAQYLTLREAPAHPAIVEPNSTDSLQHLAAAGVLERHVADELIHAMRLYRRVQGFLRLATEDGDRVADASSALKQALVRAVGAPAIDFASAETEIRSAAARVRRHYDAIIAAPAAKLPPQEKGTQ